MPQASERDRQRMIKWFGNISDHGPTELLYSRGYSLTPQHEWVTPVPAHTLHPIEVACIMFLIDEWDFGGIAKGKYHLFLET